MTPEVRRLKSVRSYKQSGEPRLHPPPTSLAHSLAGIGNYHNNLLAPLMHLLHELEFPQVEVGRSVGRRPTLRLPDPPGLGSGSGWPKSRVGVVLVAVDVLLLGKK